MIFDLKEALKDLNKIEDDVTKVYQRKIQGIEKVKLQCLQLKYLIKRGLPTTEHIWAMELALSRIDYRYGK